MAIYDIDIPAKTARQAIQFHFRKHAKLTDERCFSQTRQLLRNQYIFIIAFYCSVIGLLISKGYMELEETLKQWKQKTHLMRILEVI